MVRNLPANAGDVGLIPGLGRSSGEGNGNPLPYSCLKKSPPQRSLMGDGPWGRKEPDTTEQLTLSPHFTLRTQNEWKRWGVI